MCDMGNKLWYERDLCSCDSFTRHLLVANPTGTHSLWHLAPNMGPGAFCLCESKTVENAQTCKKKKGSQCNSPFFMSIVFSGGWKGPTRGQKCCHVVRGSQGLPSWFQGPGGPSSAAMWSWVLRGYPGDSKGHEAQNCIQPPRAQGEGLEPLLAAQETVSEAPEPKTCERVRKWHFPWIGKAHGFKEETQSELYFIILLNFNIFSQSIAKEVQPSCVSHIGFQFYNFWGFQPALVLGVPNQVRLSMVHFNIPIFPIGYNGKLQIF